MVQLKWQYSIKANHSIYTLLNCISAVTDFSWNIIEKVQLLPGKIISLLFVR